MKIQRKTSAIIFTISLILTLIAARYIFAFYDYAVALEIEKTGFGLFPGLFVIALLPGIFIAYPVVILVSLGLILFRNDGSKDQTAILLPWAALLILYAPALFAVAECHGR